MVRSSRRKTKPNRRTIGRHYQLLLEIQNEEEADLPEDKSTSNQPRTVEESERPNVTNNSIPIRGYQNDTEIIERRTYAVTKFIKFKK